MAVSPNSVCTTKPNCRCIAAAFCNFNAQKSVLDTVDTEQPRDDTAPIQAKPDVALPAQRVALPAKMKRRAGGMFASTANRQLETQTQQELTMIKIALLATAAIIAIASPAAAGWTNSLNANGLAANGLTTNALTVNALSPNGVSKNALSANSLTTNALTVNALSQNTISIKGLHVNGLSLGGIDGMKVMGIELPR